MNQLTLQLSNNNLTITLPQIIRDVKRAYKGYRVLSEEGWKFYASDCLSETEIEELQEWLIELQPGKKAA